ncbi:hypothetical protein DSL64_18750 [Dyadobacter luteus]|uniref:Glycosyltransferase RgtA/B/C/D-like domain-containing protein n=1 Tax=Dyadobacter luteus TaxID=2259619 RepID=A0A3D8Y7J5_9BACT|nr:hypothetical protein [Dyadobacter luteus]REA59001.1 hypothetical protein DSL64_18750 [Dyadobacter luteus]
MIKYIAASIIMILAFGYIVFFAVPDIPSFDDYFATLYLIKTFYFEDADFAKQLGLLFARHNEHRIVISRALAATYYCIFGKLSFHHLLILQNLFLLAFVGIVVRLYRKYAVLNPVIFLFITSFLFGLSFYQVTSFYWGGIQHYTVFVFSFLCLVCLNDSEKWWSSGFGLAVLSGMLATLSFGNGILALLMGCFLLFVRSRYKLLIIWILFTSMMIIYGFRIDKPERLSVVDFNFEWMGRLLFTFLGSFLYVNPSVGHYANIIVCMLAGIVVAGFWLWLFFSGYAFRKPLLYVLFSLPVVTGIIISISRFETKSAGGIAPRYMFFTATIPVMIVLILLDMRIIKWPQLRYILPVTLSIWGLSFYNNYFALKAMRTELNETVVKWKKDKSIPLVYYHDAKNTSGVLEWAICNKVLTNPIYDGACDQHSSENR